MATLRRESSKRSDHSGSAQPGVHAPPARGERAVIIATYLRDEIAPELGPGDSQVVGMFGAASTNDGEFGDYGPESLESRGLPGDFVVQVCADEHGAYVSRGRRRRTAFEALDDSPRSESRNGLAIVAELGEDLIGLFAEERRGSSNRGGRR
jgi:hypothetical protein